MFSEMTRRLKARGWTQASFLTFYKTGIRSKWTCHFSYAHRTIRFIKEQVFNKPLIICSEKGDNCEN